LASGSEMPPIFVVGMPRSGTTLLASLLSAHSRIAIGPETAYFDLVWKPIERDDGVTAWPAVERHLKEFLQKPSVALMQLPESQLFEEFEAATRTGHLSHRLMLSRMMEIYAAAQNKPRWGEKTPGHFMYLSAIKEAFPEAMVVYIVRDPRDIHLSLGNVDWSEGNSFNHALQWREYQAISKRYQSRYGSTFIQVRYEDLISDPRAVLERLCLALDEVFEPEMLERYQGQRLFDPKDEPWKTKVASPIDASNAGKWRSQLPQDEWGIFSRLCGAEMQTLNYECPLRAPFVLKKAWQGLDMHAVLWWARIVWRISHNRDPWLGRPLTASHAQS
jgi:LPS sulfotransferase NodH